MRKRYYAVRPSQSKEPIRIEQAVGPAQAIRIAFGRGCENFAFKDIGTRSPAYWTRKERESYLSDEGWSTLIRQQIKAEADGQR